MCVLCVHFTHCSCTYLMSVNDLSTFDEGMDKDEKEIRSFANLHLFFDTYSFPISFHSSFGEVLSFTIPMTAI